MLKMSGALALQVLDFINDKFDDGSAGPAKLAVFSGVRPADTTLPPTGTLLAEFELPLTPFPPAQQGDNMVVAEADPAEIPATNAIATGTATWFRAMDRDGVAIYDGDVSSFAGNGDLKLQIVALLAGRSISITSWIVRFPQ